VRAALVRVFLLGELMHLPAVYPPPRGAWAVRAWLVHVILLG
jgi:hypothetical protein